MLKQAQQKACTVIKKGFVCLFFKFSFLLLREPEVNSGGSLGDSFTDGMVCTCSRPTGHQRAEGFCNSSSLWQTPGRLLHTYPPKGGNTAPPLWRSDSSSSYACTPGSGPHLHVSPPTSASLILLWGLRIIPASAGRGHT